MSDHSNKTSLCLSENIPQNSKKKPLGLYFSKALFEGLILGGAYLRRDICISKLIGLALQLEVNLPFLLCFTLHLRAILQVQAPGGLIFGGAILWRVFCVTGLGGLYFGGAYFQNFMVFLVKKRTIIMLLCHVYVGNQTSLEQQQKHQAPKQSSTGKKNSFLISKIINKRYTRTCSTSMQSSVST